MRYNRNKTIDKALTVDTNAYTANDVMGGLLTFDINLGSGGVIRKVQVIDDDNEKAAMTIWFFDNIPSTIADDAAFAPTIADLKLNIGVVTVLATDYVTTNNNAIATIKDVNLDYDIEGKVDGKIYAYVVATATPTYTAATDLTLRVTVWSD